MVVALITSSAGDRFYAVTALPVDPTNGHNHVLRCECPGYNGWRKCKHIDAMIGKASSVPDSSVRWTSAGRRLFKQAKERLL